MRRREFHYVLVVSADDNIADHIWEVMKDRIEDVFMDDVLTEELPEGQFLEMGGRFAEVIDG